MSMKRSDNQVEGDDGLPHLVSESSDAELRRLAKAEFASVAYSQVESAGPAASPLGFPAPRVIRSKIVPGLCWKRSSGHWSKGNVLLHYTSEDEFEYLDVGYMFTPLTLRQTLCGEIIKGIKVKKIDSTSVKCEHNDVLESIMGENVDNLWETTDELVVIKVDRRQSMKRLHDTQSTVTNPENPWKEVAALQLLGNTHPNVINLLGAFIDDNCLYEVMPYCSGDSLSTFIRSHPNGISETRARRIFVQLLLGLHHIHSHGVCHHDISLSNIMFDEDRSHCIIIDFGMSLRILIHILTIRQVRPMMLPTNLWERYGGSFIAISTVESFASWHLRFIKRSTHSTALRLIYGQLVLFCLQ
eukprot:CCRYP_012368-RA/>CCRYP_012368-RA protein AED:0.03 eAED:0.03 QI:174/1/1/1/1/1/2/347/356